jgi:hypothetical protein
MGNLLENSGFENGFMKAMEKWNGWFLHGDEGIVCIYQRKTENPQTGFYQDIPGSKFKSDGTYRFQMKLLSPTENITVSPTVWVFKKGQDAQPTQQTFNLRVGMWQIIEVEVNITRGNLKKVRAELYFDPVGAELIIQRAYFGN